MMVGAILTQATNWRNVQRAISQLKQAQALSAEGLLRLPILRLQRLIRPAGYFRQKTQRLRAFTQWYIHRYGGRPSRMFQRPWQILRQELLALRGIGPETADCILLYAGQQPVFAVDAYTRRVFRRHGVIDGTATYETIQRLVMKAFGRGAMSGWTHSVSLYNEFHALLVAVGKRYCQRKNPDCDHCPLGDLPRKLTKEDG